MKVGRVVSHPHHLSTSRRLNEKKETEKEPKRNIQLILTLKLAQHQNVNVGRKRQRQKKNPTKPAVPRVPSVSGVKNYPQQQPSGTAMPAFPLLMIADIQNLPTTSSALKNVNVDLGELTALVQYYQ